jgi:serine/threonine-protein kinase
MVRRTRKDDVVRKEFLPEPGDLVAGKYRIERAIGRGAMGAVFEATHCVTDKRFAIKWLLARESENQDAVKRFLREAQVAGCCHHRSLVEVYDIDRSDGSLFMVMELLDGSSLADLIARQGRMPAHEACPLLLPCMEAIGEAHKAGVIHRDLKPDNIFVCRATASRPQLAKVLDFGVSRILSAREGNLTHLTGHGTIIGTPYYMPPEQVQGAEIDPRVDVYAMGATLYEVLSGVLPHDASTYLALFTKIVHEAPLPLEELVPSLPPGLGAVVGRAMARNRDERYASMAELIAALEPFCAPTASSSPSFAPLAEARSDQLAPRSLLAGRRERRLLLVAGGLLLVAAGLGWSTAGPGARGPTLLPAPAPASPLSAASPTGPLQVVTPGLLVSGAHSQGSASAAELRSPPSAAGAALARDGDLPSGLSRPAPLVVRKRLDHGLTTPPQAAAAGNSVARAAASPRSPTAVPVRPDNVSPLPVRRSNRAPARLERGEF